MKSSPDIRERVPGMHPAALMEEEAGRWIVFSVTYDHSTEEYIEDQILGFFDTRASAAGELVRASGGASGITGHQFRSIYAIVKPGPSEAGEMYSSRKSIRRAVKDAVCSCRKAASLAGVQIDAESADQAVLRMMAHDWLSSCTGMHLWQFRKEARREASRLLWPEVTP